MWADNVGSFYATNADLALRFAEPPFAPLPAAPPPAPPDGDNSGSNGVGSTASGGGAHPEAAGASPSPLTATALAMATNHSEFAAGGSGFLADFFQSVLQPLDTLASEVEQVKASSLPRRRLHDDSTMYFPSGKVLTCIRAFKP